MAGLKYMNKNYLFRLVILIGMSLPKIVANKRAETPLGLVKFDNHTSLVLF